MLVTESSISRVDTTLRPDIGSFNPRSINGISRALGSSISPRRTTTSSYRPWPIARCYERKALKRISKTARFPQWKNGEGRGHLDMEGANSGPVRVFRKHKLLAPTGHELRIIGVHGILALAAITSPGPEAVAAACRFRFCFLETPILRPSTLSDIVPFQGPYHKATHMYNSYY
ncbi:hypothetical protein BDN71DRAFT_737789 [Pleurotus eryngii]|uniref:Uncharacterized protein n=1 Tax=Pleurotus eryngii TaxID=5323 RepID=A0A9P5ZFG7_PLEER|nr:hypothetical protein BDN71DRAFT_737789 [Pleurotus eryngii]